MTETKSSAPSTETKHENILLWLVAIGFFMETLDSTIVNTAIPAMAKSLGESPLFMQSVVIAYSLTLAVFIPASGWLADRFGTRKVFLAAIVIFTIGSLSCALSKSLGFLVAARVLQGAGGSMLLPVGRLAVLRSFPGEKFLNAISFVTMPALIGPLLGPSLGGWLVEYASWHWIFLINVPIGVIGCIATLKAMPESPAVPKRPFDFIGFAQISLFMVSISVVLDGMADLNLSRGLMFLLTVAGLSGLAAFVLRAAKNDDLLFPLSLFQVRSFSIGIVGNLFSRLGSSATPFLIPLFLQVCLGYAPFAAGLTMLPIAVAGILAKKLVPPFITRYGYRNFLLVNTVLVGAGIASFALVTTTQPEPIRIVQLFFFGIVNSMQFTAMNTLALKDVPLNKSGGGNTMFSMVQMLAMSFAVATAGAVLTAFLSHVNAEPTAKETLWAFHTTFVIMGSLTCTSALIFWQLSPDMVAAPKQAVSLEA